MCVLLLLFWGAALQRLVVRPSQIGFIVYALGKPLDPFLHKSQA